MHAIGRGLLTMLAGQYCPGRVESSRCHYECTAVCVNLAIFVWSTNEVCACSEFKSLCCVDKNLFCTHALFMVGDTELNLIT